MNRRQQLLALGAVGLASAAAGLGWQWGRQRRAAEQEALDAAALAEHGGLWGLAFTRPEGGDLVMAALRGRPLVLNFWATWCPPCVKEMPELDRFQTAFGPQGWQVVGLAVDGPTPVRQFLQRVPVSFAIGLAGLEGTDLSRQLGNERGALPFTAVFDARGRLVQRKLGETSFDELSTWARAV